MDFELDDDQRAVLEAVESLLERHAGPERAVELAAGDDYDHALHASLAEAGFLDVLATDGMGPLEAALVVEAVARHAGVVSAGASALVAPAVGQAHGAEACALVDGDGEAPVRFGAHAKQALWRHAGGVHAGAPEAGAQAPLRSNFGYPMGRVGARPASAEPLATEPGTLERWWRLALAVECVGTMRGALDCTVTYLKERRQFGRPIGSFQAVQHRLAQCAIAVEGSRWLALECAHRGAPAEGAATAAAFALHAAGQVFAETHQLTGAIGFTREHPLHAFSMRLQALRLELGGAGGHRRAVVAERWGTP